MQINIFKISIAILENAFLTTDITPQICENVHLLKNVFGYKKLDVLTLLKA